MKLKITECLKEEHEQLQAISNGIQNPKDLKNLEKELPRLQTKLKL